MAWIAELNGYDIVGAAAVTLRFALGRGIAFTDAPYVPSGLTRWASPTQRIDIGKDGRLQSRIDVGEIQIQNMPDDVADAGPLDDAAEYAWQGRDAFLYWVPANVWADAVLIARGTMAQPVSNLAANGTITSLLRFPLRDPRAVLDTPLQTKKYGGTNAGGAGVDGEADIKGKVRPILYGIASNFPGVRVNKDLLIWEICDSAATILCARDGGLPLNLGTVRGNVASLQANDPGQGNFDYCSGADGTYVRFSETPTKTVTFDAIEGATEADRTHGQVWQRIRLERCGNVSGDINAASVTTLDGIDGHEVGWWWNDDGFSRRDALDTLLASLSGYEVLDLSGEWEIAKLLAPSGDPDFNIVMLEQGTLLKAADRKLVSLARATPSYAPDGSPPYRTNVQWGLNNTIMAEADFNGAAAQRLRDKFAQQWRTETVSDTAIWEPETGAGYFPNAPELTIPTGYQPGSDGRTCPHAATEAARVQALYGGIPAQYQTTFIPKITDVLLPGRVVSLTYPGFSLGAGALFRILQASWVVEGPVPTTSLVIGLKG